jgi:hypothetical protein
MRPLLWLHRIVDQIRSSQRAKHGAGLRRAMAKAYRAGYAVEELGRSLAG